MISSSQRPLTDNTQQTNIHVPGWNRTHNLSRRAAADLRLRLRGHWDWRLCTLEFINDKQKCENAEVMYVVRDGWMNGHRAILKVQNRTARRKACLRATWPTTKLAWTDSDRHHDNAASNRSLLGGPV